MEYDEEVDKCPAEYAPYRTTLDESDLRLAKDELREDDDIRQPSIAQMRQFIAKHPQIVRCRTDPVFLLRFLRFTKFNVAEACAILERLLALVMRSRDAYGELADPLHPSVVRMLDLAAIVPLGYDERKRMVVLCRVGALDPKTTTSLLQMKLGGLIVGTCQEYERIQVHGLVVIMDFSGMSMAHVGMWSLSDVRLMAEYVNELIAMRVKEVHMTQVPKFAWLLLDLFLPLLSAKMKERFKFHRTIDELRGSLDLDPSLLPTIYGGRQSLEKANDNFRSMFERQRKWFRIEQQLHMDLSVPGPQSTGTARGHRNGFRDEEAMVGSFRKLTVD
ncbi:retinaldehyde-binding protein 1-like [Anopheles bellator]|uniref:retinaldehyde-binding protein 1-like n=1 Tax=Anopheles bellator TaxID=139047 RepID=UPI00264938E4|nr:retinaldehyde-binding protein 1-like [Anopheles bellator]